MAGQISRLQPSAPQGYLAPNTPAPDLSWFDVASLPPAATETVDPQPPVREVVADQLAGPTAKGYIRPGPIGRFTDTTKRSPASGVKPKRTLGEKMAETGNILADAIGWNAWKRLMDSSAYDLMGNNDPTRGEQLAGDAFSAAAAAQLGSMPFELNDPTLAALLAALSKKDGK